MLACWAPSRGRGERRQVSSRLITGPRKRSTTHLRSIQFPVPYGTVDSSQSKAGTSVSDTRTLDLTEAINTMPTGNDRFNAEAAAWDSNPDVRRASDSALQALLAAFPVLLQTKDTGSTSSGGLEVLEIGCGTGLLSVRLAPYVRSILAVDAAAGMIDALRVKLEGLDGADGEAARRVIQPVCILLEDPEDSRLPPGPGGGKRQKFDLIISHLTLHHIPELKPLLTTMYGCLKPGGQVALTDFEDFGPEARKFHPEAKMFGVERHGIKADWFASLMKEVGFDDVDVKPAWTMDKEVERFPGEWGQEKPQGGSLATLEFPFLLCRGTRGA